MKLERDADGDDKVIREVFHPDMLGVEVALKNAPLWKIFHGEGTEMIITKSGRRMFPALRVGLTGLDPDKRYFVLLETSLADCHRYKFTASEWTVVGGAEPQPHSSTRLYVHPDSPALGSSWMSQDVLFHRAKLTNNTLDRSGNLVLTSMHKYQPRIHVILASDILALHWSPTITVTFSETQFIAVTAYQNEKITKLKIDNNPFAKGFRESGMAHTKRKSKKSEDLDHESDISQSKILRNEDNQTSPLIRRCDVASKTAPSQDDSGVSVGSASPAPVTSPSSSPSPSLTPTVSHAFPQIHFSHSLHHPRLPVMADMPPPPPPPPFYSQAFWPYSPLAFIPFYSSPFTTLHAPNAPLFDLVPHHPPFLYDASSLKHRF